MNAAAHAWTRFWLRSAIAISIVCVAATLFHSELDANPGIPQLIRSLELTAENTVGTWWCGMLLLLAAVHMTDGFMANAGRQRLAAGWLAIACVLVLLSADEVGSIHERVGGWSEILPFALALAGALAFGLFGLWSSGQRSAAAWIAVAFGLFVAVAGYEHLENNTRWLSEHPDLRATIEEGTELVAVILLLRVGLTHLRPPTVALEVLYAWKGSTLFTVLVAAAPLAYYTVGFDDKRGYPSAWLASACFLLAGLAVARRGLQSGDAYPGKAHVALALLCVLASANAVIHNPSDFPNRGYLVLVGVLVAMGALFPATVQRGRRVHYLGVLVVSLGLVAVCWDGVPLVVAHTVLPAVAALVLYCHSVIGQGAPAAVVARGAAAALSPPA